jgi:hypothetical protein
MVRSGDPALGRFRALDARDARSCQSDKEKRDRVGALRVERRVTSGRVGGGRAEVESGGGSGWRYTVTYG